MSLENLDFNEFELIELDLKNKTKAKFECDKLDDLILYVSITNYGEPINLSEYTYDFRFLKPDNKFVIQTRGFTVINNNILKIECERDCTRVAGNAKAELTFYKNDKRKATRDISIKINPNVIDSGSGASENIITALEELDNKILDGKETEKLLDTTIGIARPIQQQLSTDITEAKKWKDQLHTDVTEGKVLQPQLRQSITDGNATKTALDTARSNAQEDINKIQATGNHLINISANQWVLNGGIYEKTITHNCNSENVHVSCRNTDTKEAVTIGHKVINRNTILLKSDNNVNTSVIVSASYYKATVDLTTDVTEDVINARGSYTSLTERLDNIGTGDIVNDLITGGVDKSLSAEQGKVLKKSIDDIKPFKTRTVTTTPDAGVQSFLLAGLSSKIRVFDTSNGVELFKDVNYYVETTTIFLPSLTYPITYRIDEYKVVL